MAADPALYQVVSNWLVPPFLMFCIHYLSQISKRLGEVSESLAVVVTEVRALEKRVTKLEDDRA